MKRWIWKISGFLLLGIAYIGVVTPGLPFSPFLVGSAYCFSKGSPTMHKWLYNHKHFGPFLNNWVNKKVFPTKLKFAMIWTMLISLGIFWASGMTYNRLLLTTGAMILVAIWAWRYPGSLEEYYKRSSLGIKIGWIK